MCWPIQGKSIRVMKGNKLDYLKVKCPLVTEWTKANVCVKYEIHPSMAG